MDGQGHVEFLEPIELIRARDEQMLDRPALTDDRFLRVCRLISVYHLIDCSVSDSVRGDTPAHAVQFFDDSGILERRHGGQPVERTP